MSRRRFLSSTAALLGAACADSPLVRAVTAASGTAINPHEAPSTPFDYARLKGLARTRASQRYNTAAGHLPPAVAALDWDHWQAIRFRDERSLWAADGLRFQARFFHLGFSIRKPVRLFSVEGGLSQE